MTAYDSCIAKANELTENCKNRAIRWIDDCYAYGYPFTISEALRSKERQISLFTQGRSLGDINSLYFSGRIPAEDYHKLKDLYCKGQNRQGAIVTWTLFSKHMTGTALDCYPIFPGIPNPSAHRLKQRSLLYALDRIGARHGVYRPAETMKLGDFVHFEIYDLPLPPPPPKVAARLADRLKRLQERGVQ